MLKDRIAEELRNAMRSRDDVRRRTLRIVQSAVKNREIELRAKDQAELTDDEVVTVLQKQAKQRRDAIEQYLVAGREDLAVREREELAVIESYLPEQLSDEDIRKAVALIADDVGASSPADLGRIMGPAMKQLRGRADGKRVQEIAREVLSG